MDGLCRRTLLTAERMGSRAPCSKRNRALHGGSGDRRAIRAAQEALWEVLRVVAEPGGAARAGVLGRCRGGTTVQKRRGGPSRNRTAHPSLRTERARSISLRSAAVPPTGWAAPRSLTCSIRKVAGPRRLP